MRLSEKILEQKETLDLIFKQDFEILNFEIDCFQIPTAEEFNFYERKVGMLGELFIRLDEITTNSLYWFEIVNEDKSASLKIIFEDYKSKTAIHNRTVPARNKNKDSKILYVGIRQGGVRKKDGLSNIASRIYQHLGYYRVGSTQALQLSRWCNEKLILYVLPLPDVAKEYLNILEKLFAIKMKPIVGKH